MKPLSQKMGRVKLKKVDHETEELCVKKKKTQATYPNENIKCLITESIA